MNRNLPITYNGTNCCINHLKIIPEKIILFGFYAREENKENSDSDILIIMKNLKKERQITGTLYIEAVSLGCPVIISNIPGHIEQMGDAALAVDATNPLDIGNAIIRLLSDKNLRDNLIQAGNKLAEAQKKYVYFNEIYSILFEFQKIRNNR
jgi:glycosyltransferase involved in cell wall biosynthesis